MLPIFARWLNMVCLGLWLGGIIAIGALTAPTAFHIVRMNAALAGNTALQTSLAAGIVGEVLRKFNILSDVCAVVLLIANYLLLTGARGVPQGRRYTLAGLALIVLTFGITLYLQFSLFPEMDLAQSQANKAVFDVLHHRYEFLAKLQFPLLLIVAFFAAVRDTPPRSNTQAAAVNG